ncbi:uncharacterized protein EDB91DRAFT_1114996 [Suillus paluster]|uniref:uncharacterized protein n=1 Tax=Suillus paluster TaxID=48578 RepID=UPI001B877502|nr:uncharacterized protein EDB91DRAFT_1114996 [Suillus paluster]KAG1747827.1 hypothetical protein EDB91DRAFT_1114996 [Suillus paluster]
MMTIALSISRLPFTMRSLKVIGLVFCLADISALNPFLLAQLSIIKVAICQPNAVLHLLQRCPSLSSLTIRVHANRPKKQPIWPSFTHTRSLCIVCAHKLCI